MPHRIPQSQVQRLTASIMKQLKGVARLKQDRSVWTRSVGRASEAARGSCGQELPQEAEKFVRVDGLARHAHAIIVP
jgi:hypothetical protein